jgi:ribosome-associated heat shock protein Hsp15
VPEDVCRIDVWLWRARLFKTRTIAASVVEAGKVRMTRGGLEARLDKPSRGVKVGDELVFVIGGRLTAVRVAGLGARRGPPAEARALYVGIDTI